MTIIRRRHLVAGLTWLPLATTPALPAPSSDMTASSVGQQGGEVQVGAGTNAAATTGSSGSKDGSHPKDARRKRPGGTTTGRGRAAGLPR